MTTKKVADIATVVLIMSVIAVVCGVFGLIWSDHSPWGVPEYPAVKFSWRLIGSGIVIGFCSLVVVLNTDA
jgi:hypothetical protein